MAHVHEERGAARPAPHPRIGRCSLGKSARRATTVAAYVRSARREDQQPPLPRWLVRRVRLRPSRCR